jgi:hypothetical protein
MKNYSTAGTSARWYWIVDGSSLVTFFPHKYPHKYPHNKISSKLKNSQISRGSQFDRYLCQKDTDLIGLG